MRCELTRPHPGQNNRKNMSTTDRDVTDIVVIDHQLILATIAPTPLGLAPTATTAQAIRVVVAVGNDPTLIHTDPHSNLLSAGYQATLRQVGVSLCGDLRSAICALCPHRTVGGC